MRWNAVLIVFLQKGSLLHNGEGIRLYKPNANVNNICICTIYAANIWYVNKYIYTYDKGTLVLPFNNIT